MRKYGHVDLEGLSTCGLSKEEPVSSAQDDAGLCNVLRGDKCAAPMCERVAHLAADKKRTLTLQSLTPAWYKTERRINNSLFDSW
jgi:ribosomal protein S13